MKKKLFVTGGCGYVGSLMIQSFLDRYSVKNIDTQWFGNKLKKNHDLINRWRMRIQSILNTKLKNMEENYPDYQLDIHTNFGWVNPDDLSANTVVISYMPVIEKVKIQIILNEEQGFSAAREATQ